MNVGSLLSTQTVLLNDGVTQATIYPVWDGSQLPLELVASLWVEYNAEIDRGRSFPETHKLMLDSFEKSWFAGVAGVMVRGGPAASLEELDFLGGTECLGSFYIEPCYPGRSSHFCTAKFLVNSRVRAQGVGLRLALCFMDWAPRLGYDYALFNLVYATNTAFCKILHRLKFQLLTRLKGAGILNGFDFPVDALQFGRPLLVDPESEVARQEPLAPLESGLVAGMSDEPRAAPAPSDLSLSAPDSAPDAATAAAPDAAPAADPVYAQIKTYLQTGAYPENATRLERTRLRSRSRSYYVENQELRYKRNKALVVSDPREQLRIATQEHRENHNGINTTQGRIAARYHWAGIRETVTRAIHQCPECRSASLLTARSTSAAPGPATLVDGRNSATYDGVQPTSFTPPLSAADADKIGKQLDKEGLSLDSAVLGPAPRDANGLRPPKDPYAPGQFRWESVVYLPPEEDDDEYVPETDHDFDAAISGNQQPMSDLFHDDDVDINDNEDEEDDDEYIDDDDDDDGQDDDAQENDGLEEDGHEDEEDEDD